MVNFWAVMKTAIFMCKLLWSLFGQLVKFFGLLYTSVFGHNGFEDLKLKHSIKLRRAQTDA